MYQNCLNLKTLLREFNNPMHHFRSIGIKSILIQKNFIYGLIIYANFTSISAPKPRNIFIVVSKLG